MKNFKISKKMRIVFGAVILIMVLVAGIAELGLIGIHNAFETFHDGPYQATNVVHKMRTNLQAAAKDVGYATMVITTEKTQKYIEDSQAELDDFTKNLEELKVCFLGDPALLTQLEDVVTQSQNAKEKVFGYALKSQNTMAATAFFTEYNPYLTQAEELLDTIYTTAAETAESTYGQVTVIELAVIAGITIIGVAGLIVVIILAFSITRGLVAPIKEIEKATEQIGRGDFSAEIKYTSKDELGVLSEEMRTLMTRLQTIIADEDYVLGGLATGDFTVHSKAHDVYEGNFASLLGSMRKIKYNLRETLTQINQAADQVASGSGQVSGGAQALSQGATEQASAIQQLSATIVEISEQVKTNAEKTKIASQMAVQSGEGVAKSNEKMRDMTVAMTEIADKSQEISKIIKTIDDIAFQTNILALNAAVEAARAGAAGKGFAVVADEVRNLASKSAQAAKNTTDLIEGTIAAVEKGRKITDGTAKALKEVVETAVAANDALKDIAVATDRQADAISQVTQGVEQVSAVVQTNSATAE
ncbi:MAG: methyl-accepting chemotaxis protein, partial [Oscillospiraceae bacterium]|nr:methyl-accepting chemotaxis protein [Oscillospiraceae bacterium]